MSDHESNHESNKDSTSDAAYATKVFIIATICVVLYVGSVITFIL
jgi:hypothetical protein